MSVWRDRDYSPKAVTVTVSLRTNYTEHFTEVHNDYTDHS